MSWITRSFNLEPQQPKGWALRIHVEIQTLDDLHAIQTALRSGLDDTPAARASVQELLRRDKHPSKSRRARASRTTKANSPFRCAKCGRTFATAPGFKHHQTAVGHRGDSSSPRGAGSTGD